MKDPFIERLAAFRSISYEEAERQHREAQNIDLAENAMVTGKPVVQLAPDAPLFDMAMTLPPRPVPEFQPSLIRRVMEGLFLKDTFRRHTIHVEKGQMLTTPRLATDAEEEQFLIEDTERKMTGEP